MEPTMDPKLIAQSLNFHGQQLQKIWEGEKEGELAKLNVTDLDYAVYQERQKQLSFQDRAKRLKLQQFVVKKANVLFDSSQVDVHRFGGQSSAGGGEEDFYAILPPYETFLHVDKATRVRQFFQTLQAGGIIIASVLSKQTLGYFLKILYLDGDNPRYVADISIKALCPAANLPSSLDKKNGRDLIYGDTVRAEVLEVHPDSEKIICTMKASSREGDISPEGQLRLGLIRQEEFPESLKKAQEFKGESYEKILEKSLGFNNPNNTNHLAGQMGLEPRIYSFMKGLRGRFPEQEYAQELRQVQASKWAFRSVAEGIEHFKSGRHSEAFQCLNKALNIDPRNVEGLVARGALYANSGSFQKAIEDFESAHKLNPNHQNARKYMGETLVALGRSHEDEGRLDEALKAYESCLAVVPFHEEAQNSIEYLRTKMASVGKDVTVEGGNGQSSSEALIPGLTPSKTQEMKETLKQLLKEGEEDDDEALAPLQQKKKEKSKSKKKKQRKSRKHRRRSTSSSSSSSISSSRSTSSSSSSSTMESSSGSSHSHSPSRSRSRSTSRTRKSSKRRSKGSRSKKGKEERKEKSLSPLSKRMAMMEPNHGVLEGGFLTPSFAHYNLPALPYSFFRSAGFAAEVPSKGSDKDNEYEQRVRRFLEQTKGDSEYEDKVRKFLDETARWKKERKGQEKESKKKKKKDKSRSRDKEKSKKKKKERDEKDYDKKKRHRKRGDKYAGDLEKAEHLKEALRRELSEQVEEVGVSRKSRQRSGMDDDDEFLYSGASTQERNEENPGADLRILGLEEIPDLDDLESKLSAYYAKVEKDTGISKRKQWHEVPSNVESRFAPRRKMEEKGSGEEKKRRFSQSPSAKGNRNVSSSPKLLYAHHEDAKDDDLNLRDKKKYDMFAQSPTPPKLGAGDAVPVMKWKMQVGSSIGRFKKKERSERDKEPWEDLEEKHYVFVKEGSEEEHKKSPETEEKFVPHRSALRDSVDKEAPLPVGMQPPVPGEENLPETLTDGVGKTLQFYEKFRGGYRIGKKASEEPSAGPNVVIGNNSLSTAASSPAVPPPREENTQRQTTPAGGTPSGGPSTPGKRPSLATGAKGPKTDSEDSDSSTPRRQGGAEGGTRRRSRSASSGGESSPHSRRSRSRSRARGGRYSRSAGSSDSDSSRSYERRRRRRSRSKSSRRSSYGRHSRSGSYTGGGRGGGGEGGGGGGGGGGRYGSRSRSRSYDDRYRSSGSRSRSRSRSYDRSRSRSYDRYGSRSRSRSEDIYHGHHHHGHHHHHRRSRSGSPHRRPHDHRSQHGSKYPPGRFPRHRGGTYYRPRYQGYKNPRGGFVPRGRGYHPKFSQRGGGRPFIPRGRGRGRGRFFHYKPGYRNDKDGYHRRYEQRGRSRDRDSEDRRSSYSRGEDDPMKKVDEAKEKINRYIAETGGDEVDAKRREESLSEGEEVDEERFGRAEFVDRKVFEGKWADGDEEKGRSRGAEEGGKSAASGDLPSIEEMDKFLNKVKAQKKEEMKERNKAFVKPTAW